MKKDHLHWEDLTSYQNALLRGRNLLELTPRERADFANHSAKCIPTDDPNSPLNPHRVHLDIEKTQALSAGDRLRLANDAAALARLRRRIDQLAVVQADPSTERDQVELRRLREEARRLYTRLQKYE